MKKAFLLCCLLVSVSGAYAKADMQAIYDKLSAVAPVVGVSGDSADPASLRIDFAKEATAEQREAATQLLLSMKGDDPGIQPADVTAFLEDALISKAFTTDQMIQILVIEREKNETKRNALILEFVALGSPEQQAKLVELATKHHIKLPL